METPVLEIAVHWARPVDEPSMRVHLDDAEQTRYDRFLRAEDKARFVTGRALARTALAEATGLPPEEIRFSTDCEHCGGTHGKPRLPGRGVHFSLSHSGGLVVLALSRGAGAAEVGVDVERESDRDIDSIADMVLAAPEREVLAALPPAERRRAFHAYWSRKEALLKATGHGLAAPMSAIHVSAPAAPAEVLAWEGEAAVPTARLADLSPGPGYAASVAALTTRPLAVTVAGPPPPA
ncbi:4'-phosphopantetheinyl transferase family protein [Actinomadura xylanilytica]|uniref:4'-phosphopantetheinyl transferase family protein n=1 Tax=Actinomadura xylanilytica TaxID=887459 RepID=UPI00255A8BA4|nr:4'-phosphopantetheinyl transferase superfamily protein [Actinomadura xylanilytica]MDL4772127.1 4'-phosphopantetheinyl transferase superfamily protein [Actinomadura xylanilytica]